MKATKFIVGAGALIAILGCFMDWAAMDLSGLAKEVAGGGVPTAGMEHGGPIIIFFMLMPLIAAAVGIAKRMGRGMGALSLIGGLFGVLLGLVKYSDIEEAGALIAKSGMGSVTVASGYWVMFIGCFVAMVGGLIALIKPEPKPAPVAPPTPVYQGAQG